MREIEIRPARAADAPAISAPVREVFEAFVVPRCGAEGRTTAEITVNAAPNSLEAYAGPGFEPAGPRTTRDGLTFRPMVRRAGA